MDQKNQRTMSKVFGVSALVLGALVLAVAGLGWGYQRIGEWQDARAYPVAAQRFDVGDVALGVHCQGDGPLRIILLSGMGNPAASWLPLMRRLPPDIRTCAYDRDGLGWSGDSGLPRDAGIAAERLARLIPQLNADAPVLLVGHSYGALVARVFAHAHPEQVAGLVLIDSSHEDMGERFPPEAQQGFDDLLSGFRLAPWLNRFGIARATDLFLPVIDGLNGEDRGRALALLNTVAHMQGTAEEAKGWERSAIGARAVQTAGFGDMPLDVLVAGDWPEFMMPSWLTMQRELAALSSEGRFELVGAANHPEIAMDARYLPIVERVIRRQVAQMEAQ